MDLRILRRHQQVSGASRLVGQVGRCGHEAGAEEVDLCRAAEDLRITRWREEPHSAALADIIGQAQTPVAERGGRLQLSW